MRKYISTFVLIIVVIMLVGGLGYSFKLVLQKDRELVAQVQQNEDLKENIKELNTKIEELQDEQLNKQEEDKKEEKTDIKVPVFNVEKLSNKPENTNIVERIYDSNSILDVSVDNENNSLNLVLDGQMARQIYGYNGQTETHTIAGISDKILDAKIVSTGKDANGVKVVVLLQSGAVKYINIQNILDKSYNMKTVSNAENIVRFVEVELSNEETNEVKLAVVGIKTDGSAVIFDFE